MWLTLGAPLCDAVLELSIGAKSLSKLITSIIVTMAITFHPSSYFIRVGCPIFQAAHLVSEWNSVCAVWL